MSKFSMCELCGKEFISIRRVHKYCSVACRVAGYRARKEVSTSNYKQFLERASIDDGVIASLDWLSVTYPYSEPWLDVLPYLPGLQPLKTGSRFLSGKHYDVVLPLQAGRVSAHSERPEMGISLVVTGENLRAMRQDWQGSEIDLLRVLLGDSGRASRLDVALDVVGDDSATVHSMVEAYSSGGVISTARRAEFWQGLSLEDKPAHEVPGTFYLGSRQSDRYLRVYNKAAEMEDLKRAWLRTELQSNGKHAGFVGALSSSFDDFGVYARSLVSEFVSCGLDWWQKMVSGAVSVPKFRATKQNDTDNWLIRVVAPVIEERIAQGAPGVESAIFQAILAGNRRYRSRDLQA